jgi:hypothetical protein
MPVFKTGAFNHSAISPHALNFNSNALLCKVANELLDSFLNKTWVYVLKFNQMMAFFVYEKRLWL